MGMIQVKRKGQAEEQSKTGVPGTSEVANVIEAKPDPEVLERPHRRRFSAAYKLGILEESDRCVNPDELGALLEKRRAVLLQPDQLASAKGGRPVGRFIPSETRQEDQTSQSAFRKGGSTGE